MTIKVNGKIYPFNAYAVKCWSFDADSKALIIEFHGNTPLLKIPVPDPLQIPDINDALETKFKLHYLQA